MQAIVQESRLEQLPHIERLMSGSGSEEGLMSNHAEMFRQLHAGPRVFLLANCWDAGSACVLEHLGAPALATTSAGVAWSNGFPDGDALPVDRLVASARTITRVVKVPLSVDVEGGYSNDPAQVADTVSALLDVGVVGINLEDGSGSPDLLAAKIERVKQRATQAGIDLFVNARTDVYLRGLVPEAARREEAQKRAQRYRDAGADGLFVPKIVDEGEIASLVSATKLPLNVLAWPGLPPLAALAAAGVRRLSSGSALAQLALGRAAEAAASFVREGKITDLVDGAYPFAEVNRLLAR